MIEYTFYFKGARDERAVITDLMPVKQAERQCRHWHEIKLHSHEIRAERRHEINQSYRIALQSAS